MLKLLQQSALYYNLHNTPFLSVGYMMCHRLLHTAIPRLHIVYLRSFKASPSLQSTYLG